MTSTPRLMRTLMVGAVVLTLASAGAGCSWFKSKSKTNYTASKESQPLEVPPGLNLPDTSGATALPSVSSASASGAVSRSGVASDISLVGNAATNYPRIGAALESIEGVVINGRAEALGSFDVSYQGESFLIRVQDNAGASRLIALSPDGRILTRGPAAALLAAIKAKL
ncbi:MAG: hypothetical protein NT117_14285 [Gammaproteobacteria bacterium]|nr:hypothetical protein [Gammaproteobacteria bacterium]